MTDTSSVCCPLHRGKNWRKLMFSVIAEKAFSSKMNRDKRSAPKIGPSS